MIVCMFCGAENEDHRRFCVKCNAKFPERGLGERKHSITIGEETELNLPDEDYFDENLQILAWSVFDLLHPEASQHEPGQEDEEEEHLDSEDLEEIGPREEGVNYEAMFEAFERFTEEYEDFRSKQSDLEAQLESLRIPNISSIDNLLYLLNQSVEQYDKGSKEFDAFFEALEEGEEFDVTRLESAIKHLMGAHNYRGEMIGMSVVFSETCFELATEILQEAENPEEQLEGIEALHQALREQGFEIPEEAMVALERARQHVAKGATS